ncbi:MAG: hypothetical protein AAFU73_19060 [Planctomycetota bacterium]
MITMTKRSMGPRSGMTVVEVAIAATVFAVLLGGVMRSMQSASGLMESTSAVLDIDRKARKLGQELRTTLENASAGTVDPIFPLPGPGDPIPYQTDVRFNEIVDWSGGAVVLGPEQRLFLRMETTELDNGRDDDGDGLVDELEVVHVPDAAAASPVELVLARGVLEWFPGEAGSGADDNGNGLVDEPGFSIAESGGRLTVRWALGVVDDGGTLQVRTSAFQIEMQP